MPKPDPFAEVNAYAEEFQSGEGGDPFSEVNSYLDQFGLVEAPAPEEAAPEPETSSWTGDFLRETAIRGPGAFLSGAGVPVLGMEAYLSDVAGKATGSLPWGLGPAMAKYFEARRQTALEEQALAQEYLGKQMGQELASGSVLGGGVTREGRAEEQRLAEFSQDQLVSGSDLLQGLGSTAPIFATGGQLAPLIAGLQTAGSGALDVSGEEQGTRLLNQTLKGATTGLLTKFIPGGEKTLGKVVSKGFGDFAKQIAAKPLSSILKGGIGESLEESLDKLGGDIIDSATLGRDFEINPREYAKVALTSFLTGGLFEAVAVASTPKAAKEAVEKALDEMAPEITPEMKAAIIDAAPEIAEAVQGIPPEVRQELVRELAELTGGKGTAQEVSPEGDMVLDFAGGLKLGAQFMPQEVLDQYRLDNLDAWLASVNKNRPTDQRITPEAFETLPQEQKQELLDNTPAIAVTTNGKDTVGGQEVAGTIFLSEKAVPATAREELHHRVVESGLYKEEELAAIHDALVAKGDLPPLKGTEAEQEAQMAEVIGSQPFLEQAFQLYEDFKKAPSGVKGAPAQVDAAFAKLDAVLEGREGARKVLEATRRGEVGVREAKAPAITSTKAPALRAKRAELAAKAEASPPTSPPQGTSARQAGVNRDRSAMGLNEIHSPDRVAWEKNLENAREQGLQRAAYENAQNALNSGTPMSDDQTAGAVLEMQQLKKEHAAAEEEGAAAAERGDVAASNEAQRKIAEIEQKFDMLSLGVHRSGSAKGRALNAQKLTIGDNYDLLSVKRRATMKKGAPLTTEEAAELARMTNALKAADEQSAELQREHDRATAEALIAQQKTPKKEKSKKTREQLIKEARELFENGCSIT